MVDWTEGKFLIVSPYGVLDCVLAEDGQDLLKRYTIPASIPGNCAV